MVEKKTNDAFNNYVMYNTKIERFKAAAERSSSKFIYSNRDAPRIFNLYTQVRNHENKCMFVITSILTTPGKESIDYSEFEFYKKMAQYPLKNQIEITEEQLK